MIKFMKPDYRESKEGKIKKVSWKRWNGVTLHVLNI